MDPVERFQEYADAFEVVFDTDDWSTLEPFFTEDAVYEIHADPPFGARTEGRDAVFEALKESLDANDRRYDSREMEYLEGPLLRDGAVWMAWRITYTAGDAPELVFEGEETAHFEGDRIVLLEDHFSEQTQKDALAWLGENATELG